MRIKRSSRRAAIPLAALAVLTSRSHFAAADVTATWLSAQNGSYASTTKWSTAPNFPANGKPTGTDYVALINAVGKDYLITYSSGDAVDFLDIESSFATLEQVGGSFTPATVNLDEGTFSVTAGILQSSTINIQTGLFEATGGTLNAIGVQGGTSVINPGSVTVENGLSFKSANVDLEGTFTPTNLAGYSGDANTTANIDGGTFNISGNYSAAPLGGNLTLENSGTLSGGTLTLGSSQTLSFSNVSYLNGATIQGGSLYSFDGPLVIQNGLTLGNQPCNIVGSVIAFEGGNQTLSDANITNNTNNPSIIYPSYANSSTPGTLTIAGSSTFTGNFIFEDFNYGDAVINNGTLDANQNGLSVQTTSFTNNGLLEATNGGALLIDASTWTNSGTISATGGSTVTLSGSFTTGNLQNVSADSTSTIAINGTLTNTGATLNAAALGGTLSLAGGTIIGGKVNQGASGLTVENGGTLDGVEFTGSGDLSVNSVLDLQDNNTFDSATNLDMALNSALIFYGDNQTISNANIVAENSFDIDLPGVQVSLQGATSPFSSTLTIESNATIRGSMEINGVNLSGPQSGTLINDGVINADFPGETLWISTASLANSATLEATNGGSLLIESTSWTNTGMISATGGSTVGLGGNFTLANIGNLSADSSSTVEITGTLDNTGTTLSAQSFGGTLMVNGGTIINGTVDLGSQPLLIEGGTLNNVQFTPGSIEAQETLTFDGNSQTLDNISLVGNNTNEPSVYVGGPDSTGPVTLTIGQNSSASGEMNFYDGGAGGDTLINKGTINPGGIFVETSNFINDSLIEADDSEFGLFSNSWQNNGDISVTNQGIVLLGGNFTVADIGNLSADSTSSVQITGTLNNSNSTLNVGAYGGMWSVGGTIVGGKINQGTQPFGVYFGTLNDVQFTGTGDLQTGYAILLNVSFASQTNIDMTTGSDIYFDGASQSIDNVDINSETGDQGTIFVGGPTTTGAMTLTLGPNAIARGDITFEEYPTDTGLATLLNKGTINADDSSGPGIAIATTHFTNNGLLEATNGSTLAIQSSDFINTGTIAVHGGGTIVDANLIDVGEGTLTGDGVIDANVQLDSDPSTLAFNIAGELQDTDYDSLIINGNISLGGNLEITLANGFLPSPADVFTLLQVEDGGALSGSFANVASGGYLLTTSGTGEFMVNYSPSTGEIVLSDFQAVPEPATLAIFVLAAPCVLGRRRRGSGAFS